MFGLSVNIGMDILEKWKNVLNYEDNPRDVSKMGLPRPEWTDYLETCLNGPEGLRHPDIKEYIKELNARGYAFLVESQEAWGIPTK